MTEPTKPPSLHVLADRHAFHARPTPGGSHASETAYPAAAAVMIPAGYALPRPDRTPMAATAGAEMASPRAGSPESRLRRPAGTGSPPARAPGTSGRP